MLNKEIVQIIKIANESNEVYDPALSKFQTQSYILKRKREKERFLWLIRLKFGVKFRKIQFLVTL